MSTGGPVPVALALSGETPSVELLARFAGVGLIRGEYIFRDILRYPTADGAPEVLTSYLSTICARTTGTVTYRTMEVTAAEANVLQGVERESDALGDGLLGLRGVRRHMAHPESLDAELGAIAETFQEHHNLVVIAPFVTHVDEYLWFRERVRDRVGSDMQVGTMIETPAAAVDIEDFVGAGCRRFVVGCNDLSSLVAARPRSAAARRGLVPGLARLVGQVVVCAHQSGGTVDMAGYLTPALADLASAAGIDRVVVHYSDLPAVCGTSEVDLPELHHLADVKSRTRDAIDARRRTRARS